jgi:hypothetical protein
MYRLRQGDDTFTLLGIVDVTIFNQRFSAKFDRGATCSDHYEKLDLIQKPRETATLG